MALKNEVNRAKLTREELVQYRYINKELKQLEEAIARVRAKLENPSTMIISDMPKGQNKINAVEYNTNKLFYLENLYNDKWNKLIDLQIRIEKAIDSLEGRERTLIRYRYILDMDWAEVAVGMKYSIGRVWQIHGDILKELPKF